MQEAREIQQDDINVDKKNETNKNEDLSGTESGESTDSNSADGLTKSIFRLSKDFDLDPDFFNLNDELVESLRIKTLNFEKEQALIDAENAIKVKECNEKLNTPKISIKEKIKNFLLTLAKWVGDLCALIKGKAYLTEIVILFENAKKAFQSSYSQFFKGKQNKVEDTELKNIEVMRVL